MSDDNWMVGAYIRSVFTSPSTLSKLENSLFFFFTYVLICILSLMWTTVQIQQCELLCALFFSVNKQIGDFDLQLSGIK